MGDLTHDRRASTWGVQANDRSLPTDVRLQAALLVIDDMQARERERVRTAVVDTLRYARVYWTTTERSDGERRIAEDLENAEELTRNWDMAPGWCCPFCEEVTCDDDCPLARVRGELE